MPSAPIQALTRDGHYLPVINLTDPRFAVPDDPDSLRKLLNASHDEDAAIGASRNSSSDGC
jgi:hypothetical protein